MRKHNHIDTQTDYLRKLGYETRDVSIDTLVKWGIGLFLGTALTAVITYFGIYKLFVSQEIPQGSINIGVPARKLPPADYRVQDRPKIDIRDFRIQETQRLDYYARRN